MHGNERQALDSGCVPVYFLFLGLKASVTNPAANVQIIRHEVSAPSERGGRVCVVGQVPHPAPREVQSI